jgi:hypothetical protein
MASNAESCKYCLEGLCWMHGTGVEEWSNRSKMPRKPSPPQCQQLREDQDPRGGVSLRLRLTTSFCVGLCFGLCLGVLLSIASWLLAGLT